MQRKTKITGGGLPLSLSARQECATPLSSGTVPSDGTAAESTSPLLTRRGFLGLAGGALGSAALLGLAGCAGGGSGVASGLDAIRNRGQLNCGVKTDVVGYGYQDTATGEFQGMEIDLCHAIAANIFGVSFDEAKDQNLVNFTGVTAKTRGPLVDSGQVDLVCATYTITEERKKSWNFSDPYYTDSIGMLVLKSSGLKTVADLDGKIIGIGEGADTQSQIEEMLKEQGLEDLNISYPQYLDYPTLAAALASGNIDVFSIDRSIMRTYMNDSNELLEPDLVFGKQEYGVCTNLHATELTETVNQVVDELLNDGTIDQWAQEYGIL